MSDSFHDGEPARLYRNAPKTEPPPALDAAILAAARREVGARPRRALSSHRVPFYSRWPIPLSVAAVVVISASLVFLVERERANESEYLLAPSEQGVAQPAPRAGRARKSIDLIGTPPPAPVSPALPAAGTGPVLRQRQPEPVKPQSARSESPTGRTVGESGAAAEEMRENRVNAGSAAGKLESGAADQPNLLKQNLPPPAAPQILPSLAAPQILPLHPAAPAAATGSMPAAVPRAAQPAALAAPGASAPVDMKRRDASGEGANEPRAARAGATKPKADTEADSAEAWLSRIEALRREGKLEEAKRSLAEFRKRYPDYPLPAHLRTQ